MAKAKVSGSAQGFVGDEAEKWLRQNDPHYASSKRKWIAPTTDALSRSLSGLNAAHSSLDGLRESQPRGHGNYFKTSAGDAEMRTDEQRTDVRLGDAE